MWDTELGIWLAQTDLRAGNSVGTSRSRGLILIQKEQRISRLCR